MKWLTRGVNFIKGFIHPLDNNILTSFLEDLFIKANLLLKHAILFTYGEILVRRGFVWFITCHYRFWSTAAPAAYGYFAYGIFLLILGALFKHNFDLISILVELDLLELSDITILSPQEVINLKTNFGHYHCVQNDQLPKDWASYPKWMQRFQQEASLELQKYNELHNSHASQLPAQELKNLSDAAQQKQAPDGSANYYVYGMFFILLATLYVYVGC